MRRLLQRARTWLASSGAGDEPPALPRGGARGSAWMAVAALLVAVVATPFGTDPGRADFGRLVDGPLHVRADEGWRALQVGAAVPSGARVRAGDEPARVAVPGGVLTLAPDTELVADPDGAHVRRGSLLVEAEERLRAAVGATSAEGRGEWRIDVGEASRVATYRARVELDDGETQRDLARFRQVSVRDGALEPGARPLRYQEDDLWDTWLLADALAVDRLATRLGGTLERTYGEDPRSPEFYAAFVAVEDGGLAAGIAELSVTAEEERYGPPADVLLGVAVVDALRVGADLAADDALGRVVSLRRAGARWGLVLVEHGLGADALRDAADRALERVEASPPPEPPDPDEPVVPAEAPGPDAAPEDPGDPTDPTPGPAPGPSPDPGPGPSPAPPPDDGGSGVTDPVEDLLEDPGGTIGDLLEDPVGSGGDLLGDATGSVGDLLRDPAGSVSDTVGGVGSLLGGSSEDGASAGDASGQSAREESEVADASDGPGEPDGTRGPDVAREPDAPADDPLPEAPDDVPAPEVAPEPADDDLLDADLADPDDLDGLDPLG